MLLLVRRQSLMCSLGGLTPDGGRLCVDSADTESAQ
jgi:hypothetical protein